MKAMILLYVEVEYESSVQDQQVQEYATEIANHLGMGYPIPPAGITVESMGINTVDLR